MRTYRREVGLLAYAAPGVILLVAGSVALLLAGMLALGFRGLFILPVLFPIENIFWCEAISDIFPPLVSLTVYLLTIKRVIRRDPAPKRAA